MAYRGTDRPPRRWHHASTTLDHFAVVTFRVDPERLVASLPSRFRARTFGFADGSTGALVSVVAFVERDFAFRALPFVKVSGALVDYRTYGEVDGEEGVYVFATSLDHPMVLVPRLLWRMPWRRDRVRIEGEWEAGDPVRLQVTTDGAQGLRLDLVGDGPQVGALDGFSDADHVIEVLTHPMVGWYGTDEDLRRYSVWHDVLHAEPATVVTHRVPQFAGLGVDEPGRVHSALVVQRAAFDVHTPPRRVRRPGPSAPDAGSPDARSAHRLP